MLHSILKFSLLFLQVDRQIAYTAEYYTVGHQQIGHRWERVDMEQEMVDMEHEIANNMVAIEDPVPETC